MALSRRLAEECAGDPSHQHHVHDDDVAVVLSASLWDTVVDSLGTDYGLDRRSPVWEYTKAGYGGRYTTTVAPDIAERIAHYLESVAGVSSQTWAMDAESRPDARREASAARRAAGLIRAQL